MTQAEIFDDFMRDLSEDEGLPLYDKYYKARKVAETMGAKQVARVDDREQWLFPDGSTAEIPKMALGIARGID